MVEMVSGLMTAAKVVGYISSYRGYKFEQRKEDDKAIRSWLLVKLNDCRGKLLNTMEATDDADIRNNSRKIIDQIDLFKTEISAAETGQKLPFFTVGESADVEKLVEHDATILEEIDKIRDALTELELSVMEDIADSRKGLNMIRIGVSNARNRFGERISFIKGIK